MRLHLIQTIEELSFHFQNITTFVNQIKPKYSSHLVGVLKDWFTHFSTEENASFAAKRGLNFLGRRSALSSLFFLLIYHNDQLIAFAPLFRFKVHFGESPDSYEVISFCPDSTIFFYNDLLIKHGYEDPASQAIFEFFKNYHKNEPHIILLNHIPSSSDHLPILYHKANQLTLHGFTVSHSPIFHRGGPYPWNLSKLQTALNLAQNHADLSDQARENIAASLNRSNGSNKTMLNFKKNHMALKSSIYQIFNGSGPSNGLYDLYNTIESIFQSSPVKYPFLTLNRDPEDFVQSLSPSKRYYYKRYLDRFQASKGQFIRLRSNTITDQDIKDFISLHRERWGNTSNVLNDFTAPFLFSFFTNLVKGGLLTLYFAVFDSKRVAGLCCLDFSGRREFFSSGRSLNNDKLRAGKLLLYYTIIDSIKEGYSVFDFGYGDDSYKSDYNWSYVTNNAIALFYHLNPKQFPNLLPLYEELIL